MRKAITAIGTVVLVLALVAGCEREHHRPLQGALYFAAGSYLGRFDLADGGSSAALNLGDVSVQHISPIDDHRLLATLRGTNDRGAFSRIVQLDVRNNQRVDLFAGNAAWFLPSGRYFVIDDGRQLVARGRRAGVVGDIVLIEYGGYNRAAVIAIGDRDVLFELVGEAGGTISLANAGTGNTVVLGTLSRLCTLDGAVWLASIDRLLCRKRDSGPANPVYLTVSIDGEDVSEFALPPANSLRAVAFLDGQDAVVFTAVDTSLIGDVLMNQVWFTDLADSASYLMAKDQYLGQSVAWGAR